tara:strand:+ start:75 stop:356 length:282 start_codon:yes stop_codon:yes gene_type:complete
MSDKQYSSIGALWAREAKSNNQKYLAGHVKLDIDGEERSVKVVVFRNNNKQSDRSPDYQIYKARPPQNQEEAATVSASTASPSTGDDEGGELL